MVRIPKVKNINKKINILRNGEKTMFLTKLMLDEVIKEELSIAEKEYGKIQFKAVVMQKIIYSVVFAIIVFFIVQMCVSISLISDFKESKEMIALTSSNIIPVSIVYGVLMRTTTNVAYIRRLAKKDRSAEIAEIIKDQLG